jgi:predicted amidohydrolase
VAKLVLATCQFPVEVHPEQNLRWIIGQMEVAKAGGAQLVHFPEACLSGYLGAELKSLRQIDWLGMTTCLREIMTAARRLRLWVVVGCNHRLTGRHRPHNSLYVIDAHGRLVTRYDKTFCTGKDTRSGDLRYYSPGESLVTFRVRGVKCGLLICHDFRYPELFRAYKRQGVELVLVSFHNAAMKREQYDKYLIYVPATIQAAAASNYFTVSANNGTRRYAWPSFVVNAEGVVISNARPHRPAVLINKIDTKAKLYDASRAWRARCMRGILHSGTLVRDPRSRNRRTL